MTAEIERLSKAEGDIVGIKDDLVVINSRLTRHGQEIDALDKRQDELSRDLVVIRKDIESIDGGVKRVEHTVNKTADKLDALQTERFNDHFVRPVESYRKAAWAILGVLIGLVVTFLATQLFPMLGG